MINQSQLRIKQISNWKNKVPYTEQRLITNVVNSLAKSLQDITFNFRKAQSTYLNSKHTVFQLGLFILIYKLN